MTTNEKAKLFTNGRSQAVRLPLKYRFEGAEVFIRRDAATGDVILSAKPHDWSDFIALRNGYANDPGVQTFLSDRNDPPPAKRDLF